MCIRAGDPSFKIATPGGTLSPMVSELRIRWSIKSKSVKVFAIATPLVVILSLQETSLPK